MVLACGESLSWPGVVNIDGQRTTLDAIHAANRVHEAAVTAPIEANQAALRLLRGLPEAN
jgi:hypothetical protein